MELQRLPSDDECFKALSPSGGFCAAAYIPFVTKRAKTSKLYIATFHAGLKEIQLVDSLHRGGKLDYVFMLTQTLGFKSANQQNNDAIKAIFTKNGWDISIAKTHAKVLLFDTELGKFVMETSSNMDRNPSMEQFSLEKDAGLYDWYYEQLFCERTDMIELQAVEGGGIEDWQLDWEPTSATSDTANSAPIELSIL